MKKKIFIVLNHLLYIKNYVYTNAFEKLEKKYNCFYILDNNIKEKQIENIVGKKRSSSFKKKIIFRFKYNNFQKKIFTYLFEKIQYKHKNTFSNIKYQIYYYNNIKLNRLFYPYEKPNLVLGIKRILIWSIRKFKRFLHIIFFHKIFDDIIKSLILPNNNLLNLYKNENPDMVIIPFNGNHISIFDTIRYFKKKRMKKVLMVSENWDNLFSRYMINHPDFISVWGEQIKKPLKKQNYKGKIFTIGTPRLDEYFIKRNKKIKNPYNFNYAVFFDCANPVKQDNDIILDKIENFLEENKKKYKNFKLIFRPHPYTLNEELEIIDFSKYKNIILDPQMKSRYTYNLPESKMTSDDFKYSLSLIKNSKFILTSASSVTIEASIFYKNIILFSPKNETVKKRLIDVWEQFNDVAKFPNIKICDDPNTILNYIKKSISPQKKTSHNKIDKYRNKIVFSDGKKFSSRLYGKISSVIY